MDEQGEAAVADLVERELLTPAEARSVVAKRERLDRATCKAGATRADWLRAIVYELRLEKLRKLRQGKQAATGTAVQRGPGDSWGLKQVCALYEKALRRFANDVGLWLEYIEFARKQRSKKLVGKLYARALELHADDAALWVRAAQWEWVENASARGARRMLQRGLRFNRTSRGLWGQYLRFELLYLDQLRQRRAALGLQPPAAGDDDFFAGAVVVAVANGAFDAVDATEAQLMKVDMLKVLEPFQDAAGRIAGAIEAAAEKRGSAPGARPRGDARRAVSRAGLEAQIVACRAACDAGAAFDDVTLQTPAAKRAAAVWNAFKRLGVPAQTKQLEADRDRLAEARAHARAFAHSARE